VASADKKSEIRKQFGIEDGDVVIVSGAQDNKEIRKGFVYAEHAIKAIRAKNLESNAPLKVKVITFGHGGELPNGFGIRHIHLGFIGQEEIIKVLQIADLLFFTSIEENFSNLILEALACGCPVLGFQIGGIPDIVKDGVNGALVDSVDQEIFTARALELVFGGLKELRKSAEQWRCQEFHHYENSVIAQQLMRIYNDSKPAKYNPKLEDKFKLKGLLGINFGFPLVDTVVVGEQIKKCNTKELNTVFKGFVDFEPHPEYGRIAWIKSHANAVLKRGIYERAIFAILAPYPEWNRYNIETANNNISVSVDGRAQSVELVRDESKKYCAFLVDTNLGKSSSKLIDIEIQFKSPTVPVDVDPRGLCLIYTDLLILENELLERLETAAQKISYIESVALKTRQSWQVNKYLEDSKNAYEEINKKILMATDLLLVADA
jgi:hypothetical protein